MFQKSIYGIAIVLGSFLLPKQSYSQLKIHRFNEIENLKKEDPRSLVVFIHADWCVYCQIMKNTTFKDKKVVHLLNNDFYFFSLDSEDEEDLTFNGHVFHYRPSGANTGVHELAEALGKNEEGQLPSPSIVFLNARNEIIYQYGGYLDGKKFFDMLSKLKEFEKKTGS